MDNLIKCLPAVLAASGESEEVAEAAAIAAWKHAVGNAVNKHAVALKLRETTLVVAVGDGIWQRQLSQMRPQLLAQLNALLGRSLVQSIELRIEPTALPSPKEVPARQTADEVVPFELLAAASEIHDAELRRAFIAAAASCVRRVEKSSQNPQV